MTKRELPQIGRRFARAVAIPAVWCGLAGSAHALSIICPTVEAVFASNPTWVVGRVTNIRLISDLPPSTDPFASRQRRREYVVRVQTTRALRGRAVAEFDYRFSTERSCLGGDHLAVGERFVFLLGGQRTHYTPDDFVRASQGMVVRHHARLGRRPPAPPQPLLNRITNPSWVRRPEARQIARSYPRAAAKAGISGQVWLECRVEERGTLTACFVLSEAPQGYGFGRAALQLSRSFQLFPRTRDWRPVTGASVRVPMRWSSE